MINYNTFYFDSLGDKELQNIYIQLKEKLEIDQPLPWRINTSLFSRKKLNDVYLSLYLDKHFARMPRCSDIIYYKDKNQLIITTIEGALIPSREEYRYAKEVMEKIRDSIAARTNDMRSKIKYGIFELRNLAPYRLAQIGENYCDLVNKHTCYCTGFARCLKFLVENTVCVTGSMKRDFSGVRNSKEPFADTKHMWNATFDEEIKQWIFFDVTNHVEIASSQVDNNYRQPSRLEDEIIFYTFEALQKIYIFERPELWNKF